jgi:hypothetical protein
MALPPLGQFGVRESADFKNPTHFDGNKMNSPPPPPTRSLASCHGAGLLFEKKFEIEIFNGLKKHFHFHPVAACRKTYPLPRFPCNFDRAAVSFASFVKITLNPKIKFFSTKFFVVTFSPISTSF